MIWWMGSSFFLFVIGWFGTFKARGPVMANLGMLIFCIGAISGFVAVIVNYFILPRLA